MDNQRGFGGFFLQLFLIIIIQFAIRTLCMSFFPSSYLFATILSNLLIGIIFGIIALPAGYRSQFYKIPFFHKYALSIFVVFTIFDLFFFL